MTSPGRIVFIDQKARVPRSWSLRHRAGFTVVTIALLWLLGLEVTAAPPGSPSESSPIAGADQKQPSEPRPALSLAYVPRDAYLIAAIRPHVILKSEAFTVLDEFLSKHKGVKQYISVPLTRVEQLTVVQFVGRNDSTACIFHLTQAEDAAELVKTLQPDPEERVYAGRKYVRKKAVETEGTCVFVDHQMVVVTQYEEHLRRLIIAGVEGASKAKWAQVWQAAPDADALAFANIKGLRGLATVEGQVILADDFPPELRFVLESSTAWLAIKVADKVNVKVQLHSPNQQDAQRYSESMRFVVELMQVILSTKREQASKDSKDEGAALLGFLDLTDALLDTVTIEATDHIAKITAEVSVDDAARIMKSAIPVFARE